MTTLPPLKKYKGEEFDQWDIQLAKDRAGPFRNGDTVEGYVIVTPKRSMTATAVRVEILGKAHCHWTEGSGDDRRSYTGNEDIFMAQQTVWGKPKKDAPASQTCDQNGKKLDGLQQFPFRLTIDSKKYGDKADKALPAPFSHTVGNISYVIKAWIDISWKFDPELVCALPIYCRLDVSRPPYNTPAAPAHISKTICCCCCASPPLDITLQLDQGGYLPGDRLSARFTYENGTKREYQPKVRLMRSYHFVANGGRSCDHKEVLLEKKLSDLGQLPWPAQASGNGSFDLVVPRPDQTPTIPTSVTIVSSLQYYLQLICVQPYFDAVITAPVIMGDMRNDGEFGREKKSSAETAVPLGSTLYDNSGNLCLRCPQGHDMILPQNIASGTVMACPACQTHVAVP